MTEREWLAYAFPMPVLELYAIITYIVAAIEIIMHAFRDNTAMTDERRKERLNYRIKPRVKDTIDNSTTLLGDDHDALFAALAKPLKPTDKLRAAFMRHQETITSK